MVFTTFLLVVVLVVVVVIVVVVVVIVVVVVVIIMTLKIFSVFIRLRLGGPRPCEAWLASVPSTLGRPSGDLSRVPDVLPIRRRKRSTYLKILIHLSYKAQCFGYFMRVFRNLLGLHTFVQICRIVLERTMPEKTYVVLVADVVKSSSSLNIRSLLNDKLRVASHSHENQGLIRLPYSVTAGDEFQAISDALGEVPLLIWDLRRKLRPLSFRVGLGVGEVTGRIQAPVNRLAGEAFLFARKAIERTKTKSSAKFRSLTAFRSKNSVFDTTANLIYVLHDTLITKVTQKQWDTIDVFSKKRHLEDAAKELDLDVSTVSRNLKRGSFWQMEETIAGMRELIKHSFP